jgi:hypothetical protein
MANGACAPRLHPMSACRPGPAAVASATWATRWVAVTLKPSVMVLLVCALGGVGHLHVLPAVPGLDRARSHVDELRLELAGRWRCDTATRRALLTDGDAERLYGDVQAACPAAADPLTLR